MVLLAVRMVADVTETRIEYSFDILHFVDLKLCDLANLWSFKLIMM